MYFNAAAWFLLPPVTPSAMLPLTPGRPPEALGVCATPTLPETWLSFGSLARPYM